MVNNGSEPNQNTQLSNQFYQSIPLSKHSRQIIDQENLQHKHSMMRHLETALRLNALFSSVHQMGSWEALDSCLSPPSASEESMLLDMLTTKG